MPPLNLLLLAVVGAVRGRRRGGRALLAAGLGGLTLCALPVFSESLIAVLETGLGRPVPPGPPPEAIVILSGEQQEGLGQDGHFWHVGPLTLEREAAGATLARRTGAPVLVTGGKIHPWSPPLADLMADSLTTDFGVHVRWRETHSTDTWENATDSAAILKAAGISRVWVVTHGWHMKRALVAFRRAGLDAQAAPVVLDAPPEWRASAFVPSARAWLETYYAMHELIGWGWYELRP